MSVNDILISASEIDIIPEEEDTSPAFQEAHSLISKANILCFLGFGFNSTNLKRLNLEEVFNGWAIYGTTFKLAEVKRSILLSKIKRIKNVRRSSLENIKSLALLKNYPILG